MTDKASSGTDSRKYDRLLPCPFCGGEARHYAPGPTDHHIECRLCSADVSGYMEEAEAAEAWNTRTASGDDFSRAVHDGHLWRRCDACEGGAVPMTDEAMAAHGWVRDRTCLIEVFDNGIDEAVDGSIISYSPPTWYLSCGHTSEGTERPRYCPNCGAKAVER